jgi:tetratricopeptide (TPR) repeat protein
MPAKQPTAPAFSAPKTDTAAVVPFQPARVGGPATQILGDAGSSEALRQLLDVTDHVKRRDTLALLHEALDKFRVGDWQGGGERALKALHVDEKSGEAWHMLAIARDKCNDFATALTCYETALQLLPENPAIANDLGRLAYRLGMNDMAEKFFRFFLAKCPGHVEAINNLASTLREDNRLDEAIDLLKAAIQENQTDPQLWNALGTVVNARGDIETSIIFYEEALRHDPKHVHALYNLGNARAVAGHPEQGLQDLLAALPLFTDPMNLHTCKLSIAFCYLVMGDYRNGWAWYEARTKADTAECMTYLIPRPHWQKDEPVRGKRLFVSAEQGLGDEIMFATILPDLQREIGPEGHLTIGVEPRLVPLFEKGFPNASVVRHHTTKHNNMPVRLFPDITDWDQFDAWATMGDFLSRYRPDEASFPRSNVFFHPDPERVAYWKAQLDGVNAKPKIGILWKSLIKHSRRDRYYSPFEQWADVLKTEGVQFVNLQYGDTEAELAEAAAMGLDIWTPPGIDLKMDLDDLSALCMAMDCIVCPSNATSNIAGAAGARVWMISPEMSWNSLGTRYYPWYPNTRVFFSPSLIDWSQVMGEIKAALIEEYVRPDQPQSGSQQNVA